MVDPVFANIYPTLKILILGPPAVGKTCVLNSYVQKVFIGQYVQPTCGVDLRKKDVLIDGKTISLSFWDTAGQERFSQILPPNFYRNAHGAILVYDVTKKQSFVDMQYWLNELKKNTSLDTKIIIVGNKTDQILRSCDREVQLEDLVRFAKTNGALFMETSAKLNDGIQYVFEELAREILKTPSLWKSIAIPRIELEEKPAAEKPGTGCRCTLV